MNPLTFVTSMLHGRPIPLTATLLALAIPQVAFYTVMEFYYAIAVWGLDIDSTLVVLPFIVPGYVSAFYLFAVALQYKDLPSILVCIFGLFATLTSLLMTIPAFMYDWPGMTRLSFFNDTALTDLAREQSQAPFIIIFILLFFKFLVEPIVCLVWAGTIVWAFIMGAPPLKLVRRFAPKI